MCHTVHEGNVSYSTQCGIQYMEIMCHTVHDGNVSYSTQCVIQCMKVMCHRYTIWVMFHMKH